MALPVRLLLPQVALEDGVPMRQGAHSIPGDLGLENLRGDNNVIGGSGKVSFGVVKWGLRRS